MKDKTVRSRSGRLDYRFRVGSGASLTLGPASTLARMADSFRSVITLTRGRSSTDARSLLGILSLEAAKGSEIKVAVEGTDAVAALRAIKAFLATALRAQKTPSRDTHTHEGEYRVADVCLAPRVVGNSQGLGHPRPLSLQPAAQPSHT